MKAAAAFLASVITAIGSGGATTTPSVIAPCVTIEKTLQLGSKGGEVSKLQQFLKVQTSGYFGPVTRSALVKWQTQKGIVKSPKTLGAGTTGPKTRAALGKCPSSINSRQATPLTVKTEATSSLPAIQTSPPPNPLPPPPPAVPQAASIGTSGGIAPGCPSFTTPKPTSYCSYGDWEKVIDESGCYIDWDCFDPNPGG